MNADALAEQGFRFHRNVRNRGSQYEYALAAMSRAGELLTANDARIRYKVRTLEEQAQQVDRFAVALKEYPNRWNEHTAIFSSEHILPWIHQEKWIKTLDEMFCEVFTEVRYIVYFRAQPDLVVSQYSERIKRGATVTLDQFIDRRLKQALNHFRPAKRWANAVGMDRIDVRLMDPGFLKNGDLIEDFCGVCGIDPTPLSPTPRANPSLNASAAECLRCLNVYIPEILPEGGYNPMRKGLLADVMKRAEGGPKLRLLPEEKEKIDAKTAASNEKLRQQFFPNRKALFTSESDTEGWQSRQAAKEQALDIVAQLFSECRAEKNVPSMSNEQVAPSIFSQLVSRVKRTGT